MKTKPQKKCPAEFELNISMRVWAAQQVPGVDVDFETASFMDHQYSVARIDWNATWRNWMREAYRRQNKYQPARHKPQVEIACVEMEKLKSLRAAWGIPNFREPNPGETVSEYRRAMSSASDDAKAKPRLFAVK